MKRFVFFLTMLSLLAPAAFASRIPADDAAGVALKFMQDRISSFGTQLPQEISIAETIPMHGPESPLYYLFNLNPEGWIAVASDDAVFPILAYSFQGRFDRQNQAPQFEAWMKQYEDQIRYAIAGAVPPFPNTVAMWNKLSGKGSGLQDPDLPDPLSESPANRSVEPLITTTWNQSPWYNQLCPADPAGPGGHCVAGCVPVCMAQVMYYFRWPETGTGSYTYTDPNYGEQSADFGATTYQWNEMTNSINKTNLAIAGLLYHLGVSCDLQYGPTGSGMYNHKAAYSLRTYFKYAPETQYLFRDSTTLNWDSVLIAHLDRNIPMYYAGWSEPNVSGHAFVCDGYQDSSFFHFNFGWGGSSDGYFYTSDLTPGGNNFNLAQEVVINCVPDSIHYTYPVQCAGDQLLTFTVGSFEDGSGPIDGYQPSTNCSWLINPQSATDSITSIILNFDRFETQPTDFLTIYDGATTNDPVLGQYSGDVVPVTVSSTGNKLLTTFTVAGTLPANGFLAHYSTTQPVWCSGTTTIVSDTALVSDGSFEFNYYNNTLCKWKIESPSGNPLTIWFNYFDTEEGHDFLSIYDLVSGDTLAVISGHYTGGSLPDSVTSPSGKMFLIFSTNSTITADGWSFYYPKKSNTGIQDARTLDGITCFPNPAKHVLNIRLPDHSPGVFILDILSYQGVTRLSQKLSNPPDGSTRQLDLRSFRPGLYLVRVTHETGAVYTEKIVID